MPVDACAPASIRLSSAPSVHVASHTLSIFPEQAGALKIVLVIAVLVIPSRGPACKEHKFDTLQGQARSPVSQRLLSGPLLCQPSRRLQ